MLVTESDNELIALAYSMAAEPQQFHHLVKSLDNRMKKRVHGDVASEVFSSDEVLTEHFHHALALLERQGRRVAKGASAMKYMESDVRPSALISTNGVVEYANQAAQTHLAWKIAERLPSECFEEGDYERFLNDLSNMENIAIEQFSDIYNLNAVSAEHESIHIALSKSINKKGESVGRLSTIQLSWSPEIGAEIQASLGLTPIELDITRAIVNGLSMDDFAIQMHRSTATAHTQLKSLLTKLKLRSKVELACLYSGFSQFSSIRPLTKSPNRKNDYFIASDMFQLADGRNISYDAVGKKSGKPVIFFHALVGGISLTEEMLSYIDKHGLRLIMPWRPNFAGSSPIECGKGAAESFAEDINALLDHLEIKTCQFLAHISGSVFAYASAVRCAERVSNIVVVSSIAPVLKKHLKKMRALQRTSFSLVRYTPKLLPLLMRAALAKIDIGFDLEMWQDFYRDSSSDRACIETKEIKELMRKAHAVGMQQGHQAVVQEVMAMGQDWGHWLHQIHCPVTIYQGVQDPSFKPALVEEAIAGLANFSLNRIEDAGQLLFYKKPELIFNKLSQYA